MQNLIGCCLHTPSLFWGQVGAAGGVRIAHREHLVGVWLAWHAGASFVQGVGLPWGYSPNLAMAGRRSREQGFVMHSMSEASVELINEAHVVEVMLFSPDGDPLATAAVSKAEAMRLVCLPPMMGHAFRAAREPGGRVFVEPVEWED